MTIPNAITFVRLLLVPVFAWAFLADRAQLAFGAFLTAAISDTVDGTLARLLDQRSRIGAILDPIADKLLGLAALLLLVWVEALPPWLLALSLLRDAVVLGVGVYVKLTGRQVPDEPTRIGKYATFALLTTVTLCLIARAWGDATPAAAYVATAGTVAGACLLVATTQYALRLRSPGGGSGGGASAATPAR